jgi:hypothetical protein
LQKRKKERERDFFFLWAGWLALSLQRPLMPDVRRLLLTVIPAS